MIYSVLFTYIKPEESNETPKSFLWIYVWYPLARYFDIPMMFNEYFQDNFKPPSRHEVNVTVIPSEWILDSGWK